MKVGVINRTVLEKLRDEHGILLNPKMGEWGGEVMLAESAFGPIRLVVNNLMPPDTIYAMDAADVQKFNDETREAWGRVKARTDFEPWE